MQIQFVCESCGGLLETEETQGGRMVDCPHCGITVTVPSVGGPAFVQFSCLACGSEFGVPAQMSGKRTHCPDCGASLEVPSTGSTPPPTDTQMPPVPPPPMARPVTRTSKTTGYAIEPTPPPVHVGSDTGPSTPVYLPGKKKTNSSTVILLVLCGVLGLILLMALIHKLGQKELPRPINLIAGVTYSADSEEIAVKNQSLANWSDLTVKIHVGSTVYTHVARTTLPANANLTIPLSDFSAPGMPTLDPFTHSPQMLVVSAILPDGNRASRTVIWPSQQGLPMVRPPDDSANPTPPTDGN